MEYSDFYLVAVYVPNSGLGLKRLKYRIKEWDKAFKEYLIDLSKKKDLILTGDLNVAHKDPDILNGKRYYECPGFTIEETENFSRFLEEGFVDTYIHLNPEKIKFGLDYFIVNKSAVDRAIESDILIQYEASDHYPIKLIFKS